MHFRISYYLDRIHPYTTYTSLYMMSWLVGWFIHVGQGEKGVCVGKKVNCGPVGVCMFVYRISANRRHGVYLFSWSVWCGHYSRAAFIRGRRLLLSAV